MAVVVVVFLLFAGYLAQSRSLGTNADGASFVLQASDMLHGNWLLRGWWLSAMPVYTTELPEYMLVELARGVNPGVINVAGAATFTVLLLLAALLAKGRATGTEALARVLITVGIMFAPGPPVSSGTLLNLLITSAPRSRCCSSGWQWTGWPTAGTCPGWPGCCSPGWRSLIRWRCTSERRR